MIVCNYLLTCILWFQETEEEKDLVQRLRKQEEKEHLRNMLTQLTQEMRAKYQISGQNQESLSHKLQKSKELHNNFLDPPSLQAPKELYNSQLDHSLPQPQKKEAVVSSISQTPAQQQSLSPSPLPFVPEAAQGYIY